MVKNKERENSIAFGEESNLNKSRPKHKLKQLTKRKRTMIDISTKATFCTTNSMGKASTCLTHLITCMTAHLFKGFLQVTRFKF